MLAIAPASSGKSPPMESQRVLIGEKIFDADAVY